MLSCIEVTKVCSAEMERPLRLGEQMSLRLHLMMCTGCTQYREQLKTMRQVLRAYADGQAVTDGSRPAPPD